MKKIFLLFIVAFVFVASHSQKTIHDENVELRTVGNFHSIDVSAGIDVYLSNGEDAVAVSAKDESVRSRIKTEVKNGVLKIAVEWKDGLKINIGNNSGMKAYVSVKNLEKIKAIAGVTINIEGVLKTNSLSLQLSAGSDIKGKVDIKTLSIEQSSGSDVSISGVVNDLTIKISSGSRFKGYELVTATSDIKATGGSDVSLTVNNEISAEVSGASEINWKGTATIKKVKASGAGSVSHKS